MDIHEHQAKGLLEDNGVLIQRGLLATTAAEAIDATKKLTGPWVVKAQVHTGGRGKGGGIKFAKSPEDVQEIAHNLLGKRLITPQTQANGQPIHTVYIVEACDILEEYYLSLLLDRSTGRLMLVVSSEGGGEIEEVAEKTPEKVVTIILDPLVGVRNFHIQKMLAVLPLPKSLHPAFAHLIKTCHAMMYALDLTLIEINPLVIADAKGFQWTQQTAKKTPYVQGAKALVALDAKISFDDNARFRQHTYAALEDTTQEEPRDVQAKEKGLNYIQLSGEIGCMVNGAGLAMATMDLIQHLGGEPANFLDVGGGANQDQVTAAFTLLALDPQVKTVFVNIFGGIVHCDVIARGIISAARATHFKKPLVVRLAGTNVAEGLRLLKESALNLHTARDFEDAAKTAVRLTRGDT